MRRNFGDGFCTSYWADWQRPKLIDKNKDPLLVVRYQVVQ
jgi:hypothetical protein